MSIAGINGYNYSNYYTGTKRNTAKANGMNSGLLSNVSSTSSNITLHMSGTEDSGNALTAVGFPDGSSASVYKSDAYDSANPEYRVRYWDKEGNYTDTNVQINDVDPRNASYLEMLAYTTYSDVEGFTKNAFGDFMNAAGGVEMMKAAREGLGDGPILIAVTQLTSTSEEQMHDFQNIQTTLQESVVHYAQKTAEAGLDGVVCSAHEVAKIKEATNQDFICLTPGIRPAGAAVGDQKRVMTPADARQIGSDYIVVGRPITQADDPVAAYHDIKAQWIGQ